MICERLTDAVIVATVVFLVAYNVAIASIAGSSATISVRLQMHACRFPEIAFIFGALCGHWFWKIHGDGP